MATAKYTNLASGTLTVGVNTSDTSLVLDTGEGAAFPSAGDFWVVLAEGATREICKCTSRSSDTLTVTRNQGGTNSSFTTAATLTHVITSQMLDQIRSDQVQTGALASRPSAEKDGILYLPSDGLHLFRDTGAAWGAWGPLFKFTPPVDGDFAWINQGGATITDHTSHVVLAGSGAGSSSLRIRKKAAPSTPYTITMAFIVCCAGGTWNFSAGMCIRQSSDGKVIVGGRAHYTGQPTLLSQDFGSPTAFSSNNFYIGHVEGNLGFVNWIRYHDNGTNRYWSFSADGQNFVEAFNEGRTTYMTADEVGFYIDAYNGNTAMTVLHWAES